MLTRALVRRQEREETEAAVEAALKVHRQREIPGLLGLSVQRVAKIAERVREERNLSPAERQKIQRDAEFVGELRKRDARVSRRAEAYAMFAAGARQSEVARQLRMSAAMACKYFREFHEEARDLP